MQIFQTKSSTRWNRFKWLTCFVLLAVIVSVTVLIVALQQVYTPALPFTHPNIAEISPKRALLEIESTRLLLECITGHSTILFRAPYNADFEPEKIEELLPVAIARTKNYLDVGESIDPLDWKPGVSADSIVARTIRRKQELTDAGLSGNVILLHDAGGNTRSATIAALPRIISYFKKQGYQFTPISNLLGKQKAELMPAVPKGKGYYLVQFNYVLAEGGYWAGKLLFVLFIVFIVLSMARLALLAYLAMRQRRKEKNTIWPPVTQYPFVSVIVPAYNEAVNAVDSLNNLLKTNWPNTEIIFVDDGSKDGTYEKVYTAFHNHSRVKVFTKPNGGKASALNFGIKESKTEYVVCVDADTHLHPDAIGKLMRHFASLPPSLPTRREGEGQHPTFFGISSMRGIAKSILPFQRFKRKSWVLPTFVETPRPAV